MGRERKAKNLFAGRSPRSSFASEGSQSISSANVAVPSSKRTSDLPKIMSLFGCIDPLPAKQRKRVATEAKDLKKRKKKSESGRSVSNSQRVEFVDQVSTVLKLLSSFQHSSGTRSCVSLFYKYMLESIENDSFRNLLPYSQAVRLKAILSDYIFVTDNMDDDAVQQSLLTLAGDFLTFLEEHPLDPFSCLIGIPPAKDLIPLMNSDQPLRLPDNADFSRITEERDQILQTIFSWAMLSDPMSLQKQVRQFASRMQGVALLPKGTLVIIEIEAGLFRYGRFLSAEARNLARVSTDPKEIDSFLISVEAIHPLEESAKNRIRELSPLEMEKLVELPTNALYHDLMAQVEALTLEYLSGVDMDAIRNANLNCCSISELNALKTSLNALTQFGKQGPPALQQSLRQLLDRALQEFRTHMNSPTAFKPTVEKNFKGLQEFDILSLVAMHVGRYRGICESGLDQLKLEKRSLMSGERKDEISEWWLQEIDREVLSLLKSMGYKYEAVPENYVERPPDDLEAVQENVRIISPFLKDDNTPQRRMLEELIKRLQERIYPKIEEFVRDAQIVLSEQFCFDLMGENFNLELVEEAFQREKDSIEETSRQWIEEMIKDIHYLNEMHKLEDPEYAKDNEVSFHIVPVSGLVVGMFTRLENECKTVCELWEPVDDYGAQNRTQLHHAIAETDTAQIFEILATSPEQINLSDENGFTPVHCAASTYTIAHLEILEKILGTDGIQVNAKTLQGNTPLFYLVRFPVESKEEYKDLLLRVVKKIIELGADVEVKNLMGETCLHSACLLDNASVVNLLIACGASPTATNLEGENCLHVAVKSGNTAVVKSLLQFGGLSHAAQDKELIQLARESPSPQMVQLLLGEKVDDRPRTKYKLAAVAEPRPNSRFSVQLSLESLNPLHMQLDAPLSARSAKNDPLATARRRLGVSESARGMNFGREPVRSLTQPDTLRPLPTPPPKHTRPSLSSVDWHSNPNVTNPSGATRKRTQISMGSNRESK